MDNLDNLNQNVPKIVFKDTETKPVTGAVCAGGHDQIRVAFLEEKLTSDDFGNVEMIQECSTQIVMTPEVARNIIHVLEENLASNNY